MYFTLHSSAFLLEKYIKTKYKRITTSKLVINGNLMYMAYEVQDANSSFNLSMTCLTR